MGLRVRLADLGGAGLTGDGDAQPGKAVRRCTDGLGSHPQQRLLNVCQVLWADR